METWAHFAMKNRMAVFGMNKINTKFYKEEVFEGDS